MENDLQRLGRDPLTRVLDLNFQPLLLVTRAPAGPRPPAPSGEPLHVDAHMPPLGELHSVAGEVHQDLPKLDLVPDPRVRHAVFENIAELDALSVGQDDQALQHFLHALPAVEGL